METTNNWILNLLKDNLREEIPELAKYSSAVDVMMVIKNALRDRRRDAQHIENQRDELLEALDIALKHTDVGDYVIAYSCIDCDEDKTCYKCEKAKRNIAEVSEARAIRDKIKLLIKGDSHD